MLSVNVDHTHMRNDRFGEMYICNNKKREENDGWDGEKRKDSSILSDGSLTHADAEMYHLVIQGSSSCLWMQHMTE